MRDKEFLMIPGPTPVPESVLLAMARHPIGHRTPEFTAIFNEVSDGLRWLFQTKQDVLTFASSGSGAMEAAIYGTVNPGDKVLAIVGGKFGERWRDLAKTKGADVDTLDVEWGKPVNIEDLKAKLYQNTSPKYKIVCITHNETSTGVTNPLKEIAQVVREYDALLFVDAVTSLGAINMPFDEWGIDMAVSGSQKGFMCPPGLGFLAVSEKAWAAVDECKNPSYYFNLRKAQKNLHKGTTPYTPAVNMFIGLKEALSIMKEEGLENIFRRHEICASAIRAAVPEMGLKMYVDDASARSNSISAILAPDGMNADDFRKAMNKRFDISMAGGQEHLKGKIFRIGTLGFCAPREVLMTISCMEVCLAELGYNVEFGKGSAAANRVVYEMTTQKEGCKV